MKIISDKKVINEHKWKSLITASSFASPFQTPEYCEVIGDSKELSFNVFAIEQDEEYTALLVVTIQSEPGLKSIFSKRGIIYGGPLIRENNIEGISILLKCIKNYYRAKLIYIEFRNYFDYSAYKHIYFKNNYKYIPWLNYQMKITDINEIILSMSKSRIRQIKKSIGDGVVWNEANNIDKINSFYDILSKLYKEKVKKPIYPKSFFIKLYKSSIAKYLLVEYNNKIIGGILCLVMPGKAIYEFYVCGLNAEYKHQYPSVMATWAAIEYAQQNDIPMFDFMGAGSPSEEYGVREFKARFGGVKVEYGRYLCVLRPVLYKTGILGHKIISKLPI
jgi:serine/alanine adding enzyme